MVDYEQQRFFHYTPLAESCRSIRFCQLLPDVFHAPIRCRLLHSTLDETRAEYTALSYEWGGQWTEPRFVWLDDVFFHVRPNLYLALQHLRKPNEVRTLWIDAICINQCDVLERNAQVALMGQIYSEATQVAVWLGLESEDSGIAMAFLNAVIHSPKTEKTEAISKAVTSLCKRDYWSRAWIRQEVVLAKEIRIHCGLHSTDWRSLTSQSGFSAVLTRDDPPPNAVKSLHQQRTARAVTTQGQTLELIVYLYASSKPGCSDLRDRVFAILSLASDCVDHDENLADYRLSRAQIFFGLLAFCKPSRPAAFACMLQEILEFRFCDIKDLSDEVVRTPFRPGSEEPLPYLQRAGEFYIRNMRASGWKRDFSVWPKSLAEVFQGLKRAPARHEQIYPLTSNSDILKTKSMLDSTLCHPTLSSKVLESGAFRIEEGDRMYRIGHTAFALIFRPSPLGPLYGLYCHAVVFEYPLSTC